MQLPSKIKIVKEGDQTEYYDAESGDQIHGVVSARSNLSNGKDPIVTITFEAWIDGIEIVHPQMALPGIQVTIKGKKANQG